MLYFKHLFYLELLGMDFEKPLEAPTLKRLNIKYKTNSKDDDVVSVMKNI